MCAAGHKKQPFASLSVNTAAETIFKTVIWQFCDGNPK